MYVILNMVQMNFLIRIFAVKASKSRAAVSSCTYTSRGATVKDMVTVTLNLRRAPSDKTGTTPEAAKAGTVKLNGSPVDVAGQWRLHG
jgi:hypothetical protein